MKDREISFLESMLGDISRGIKTQTRRVIDPQTVVNTRLCPYGQPGDHLLVRCNIEGHAATRMRLEILSVRIEWLQDISEEDARAEGFEGFDDDVTGGKSGYQEFAELWMKIYGPSSWDTNPMVWVIEFKVARP